MDLEILKTLSQFAGIGGISLGIFFLLCRDIILKKIFPKLTKGDAYKLFRLIIVLSFAVAVMGMAAYVAIFIRESKSERIFITGNVYFSDGAPVKNATVFVEGFDNEKRTNSIGWFIAEVNNQKTYIVKVSYNDKTTEKKVNNNDIKFPVVIYFPFTNDTSTEITPDENSSILSAENNINKEIKTVINQNKRKYAELNDEKLSNMIFSFLHSANLINAIGILYFISSDEIRWQEAKHIFEYCIINNKLAEAKILIEFLPPAEKKGANQRIAMEELKGGSQ